jgi:hypothetical protein
MDEQELAEDTSLSDDGAELRELARKVSRTKVGESPDIKAMKTEFVKGGFAWKMLDHTDSKVIYSQAFEGKIIGYVVSVVKFYQEWVFAGRTIAAGPSPTLSDSAFGSSAWQFQSDDYDRARGVYAELA